MTGAGGSTERTTLSVLLWEEESVSMLVSVSLLLSLRDRVVRAPRWLVRAFIVFDLRGQSQDCKVRRGSLTFWMLIRDDRLRLPGERSGSIPNTMSEVRGGNFFLTESSQQRMDVR
jgi:hypothetical protein